MIKPTKPTNPAIRLTCEACDGSGCSYQQSDDYRDYPCSTCDGDRWVFVAFDAETCTLGFYTDASFSTFGFPDHEPETVRQLTYCYDDTDRAILTAWFAANAAECQKAE